MSLANNLSTFFERDLNRLKQEVLAYPNTSVLWQVSEGITNSGGNLCLHLIGNLNHFIGAVLGNTGYVRNRPAEFGEKDVPTDQLIAQIAPLIPVIQKTLGEMTEADLQKPFPQEVLGKPWTTEAFLLHLMGHLNYHLGQINYHRRLLS